MKLHLFRLALVLSLVPLAHAQHDDCSQATPIAGAGLFPFSTIGATDSGQMSNCNVQASHDAWFAWTPAVTDNYLFSICDPDFPSVLSLREGCGNNQQLVCDDGFDYGQHVCGGSLFDSAVFANGLTAGTTYWIQIDGWGSANPNTGTGLLEIQTVTPPPNDECATPQPVSGQGTSHLTTYGATTGVEGQSEAACGGTGIDYDLWYEWTADADGLARVSTCSSTGDTKFAVYPAAGCPLPGSALACNDDQCGLLSVLELPVTSGTSYLIQLGDAPGALANDVTLQITISSIGPGPGTNYCATLPLSTGVCTITATGSTSIAANDLILSVANLPNQPGLFIAGPNATELPFFNGYLCVGFAGLQRFGTINIPSNGLIVQPVDLATAAPGGLSVVAGQAFHYQRWNRDPAGEAYLAGFTDGYRIVYTP